MKGMIKMTKNNINLKIARMFLLVFLFMAMVPVAAISAPKDLPALKYTKELKAPYPIPPSEKGLQTITAVPYFKVSDKLLQLEGAVYDRENNLYFVSVFDGQVFKLTPDKKLSVILPPNQLGSAGLAIHKDGRIFIAGLGNFKDTGTLVAINPDGSGMQTIIPDNAGYLVDDLVFDSNGGIYFTDFNGTSTNPTGGVYYVYPPDYKKIVPVLPNMTISNGVAISPDGKVLWSTELCLARLHRINLVDEVTPAPFGTEMVYQFTGFAPDSMRTDADGNVYVAMYSQGRVLVFNKQGAPIGQILLPGREKGHNMRSTSMAIKPGTNEMVIVTNDGGGSEGAQIFTCKAFGKAPKLYSHQ
jgi:lactonase